MKISSTRRIAKGYGNSKSQEARVDVFPPFVHSTKRVAKDILSKSKIDSYYCYMISALVLLSVWPLTVYVIPGIAFYLLIAKESLILACAIYAMIFYRDRVNSSIWCYFFSLVVLGFSLGLLQFSLDLIDFNLLLRGYYFYYSAGFFALLFGVLNSMQLQFMIRLNLVVFIISAWGLLIDSQTQAFRYILAFTGSVFDAGHEIEGVYRAQFLFGATTAASVIMGCSFLIIAVSFRLNLFGSLLRNGLIIALAHVPIVLISNLSRVGLLFYITSLLIQFIGRISFLRFLLLALSSFFAVLLSLLILRTREIYLEVILNRFRSAFSLTTDGGNITRLKMWELGWHDFLNKNLIFGSGLGTGKARGIPPQEWMHYESTILLILNEAGLFGLFVFLPAVVLPVLVFSNYRIKLSDRISTVLISATILVVAFVNPSIHHLGVLVLIALLFALLKNHFRSTLRS